MNQNPEIPTQPMPPIRAVATAPTASAVFASGALLTGGVYHQDAGAGMGLEWDAGSVSVPAGTYMIHRTVEAAGLYHNGYLLLTEAASNAMTAAGVDWHKALTWQPAAGARDDQRNMHVADEVAVGALDPAEHMHLVEKYQDRMEPGNFLQHAVGRHEGVEVFDFLMIIDQSRVVFRGGDNGEITLALLDGEAVGMWLSWSEEYSLALMDHRCEIEDAAADPDEMFPERWSWWPEKLNEHQVAKDLPALLLDPSSEHYHEKLSASSGLEHRKFYTPNMAWVLHVTADYSQKPPVTGWQVDAQQLGTSRRGYAGRNQALIDAGLHYTCGVSHYRVNLEALLRSLVAAGLEVE